MFLVALFVLLYMLFGHFYMLLSHNRIKVCLQSICNEKQEKRKKKVKELRKKRWNYNCTKIPKLISNSFKHFMKKNPSFHHSKVPRQEIIKFGQRKKSHEKIQAFANKTCPSVRFLIHPDQMEIATKNRSDYHPSDRLDEMTQTI